MKMRASSDIFLFEEFRLDRVGGGLFRRDDHGAFVPVGIGSRALDILAALIERRGGIVSKEEIMAAGWPRTVVAEGNLFVQISALRRVLDREQSGQSCIQTVTGRGYRFIAPVTRCPVEGVEPPVASANARLGELQPSSVSSAERRQLTVMSCDLVGSTALASRLDPEDLREIIAAYHRTVAEVVAGFDGFVSRYMGDGLLVYFGYQQAHEDDAERAVRAGLACIDAVRRLYVKSVKLQARIGIATGLAVVGDLLGERSAEELSVVCETPNLAAHLHALAEPDTVVIAAGTRRLVGDLFDYCDLGAVEVKGITAPVPAWQVLRPSGVASRFEELRGWALTQLVGRDPRRWPWRQIAALFVVLAVSGSLAAWIWDHPRFGSADMRPRLSMVVLPFSNLGTDPDQEHFVDAITSDLTTELSRIGHSFVVSRNTAFTYRNKSVDTKQIGRELGVRYVLEGSVRRSGNKVRVDAQLIDAETDALLWAQQFDRDVGNLLVLEDDITRRIALALGIELVAKEAARPTRHPDAFDFILRGTAVMNAPKTRKTYAEAISLFDRALTLDPQAVEAQSRLAIHLAGRVTADMTDAAAADIVRAEDLAEQAVAAAPRSPLVHMAKAQVLFAQNRCDEAIYEYETVLTLNRNFLPAYFHIGLCKLLLGSVEEAIPFVERAIRLGPGNPDVGFWYQAIGRAYFMEGRTDEGVMWLEKARGANPAQSYARGWLASAYALNGQLERAATELAEARRLSSDDRYSSIARLTAVLPPAPKFRTLAEPTYYAGLRKAGMPEE
jgi:adenylate cyclase